MISYSLQWKTPKVAITKYNRQEVAQLSLRVIRAKIIKNREKYLSHSKESRERVGDRYRHFFIQSRKLQQGNRKNEGIA